jgi:hypothetical protein
MVTHSKAIIEISDNLLIRAKKREREKRITLRSLIEKTLDQPLPPEPVAPAMCPACGPTA